MATGQVAAVEAPQRDLAAARFLMMCAGCHSVTGAKLSGPELTPATTWPEDQLKSAIKKMEPRVGPLSEDVLVALTALLKAADLRERLKVEGERMAAMFMAKMEPGDAAKGRALFFGELPLRNGGLACAACHVAEGRGGNLGPALNGIYQKAGGEMPLLSAIEQSKYKIMEPHYTRHPVTKQEALHLTKYLARLDPHDTRIPAPLFASIGAGGAVVLLAGLYAWLKSQSAHRSHGSARRRTNS
jgi:cytochrome c553